jgi:cytochrome c-type biogenesis protein CcmH/NrfF
VEPATTGGQNACDDLQTGILAEFKRSAFRTRFGQHRADLKHQPIDVLLWAAPYLAIAAGVYMVAHRRPARFARS